MVALPGAWDEVVDVVVVGSGGAALVAATLAADGGAKVLVVEKADVIGGTTGVSGGVMWVPCNHHLAEHGLDDSREEALAYVRRIADGRELDPSLIDLFIDTAPQMLDYLEAHTPLRTQLVTTLPDYYGPILDRIPGCKPFSRCVEPLPFPARDQLGADADRIAARSDLLSLGSVTTLVEDVTGADPAELARRERAGARVKGAALIAALLKGLLDRGVEVRTSAPADELIVDSNREVVGLTVRDTGGTLRSIGARRGVVLACGGFEWNPDMVLAYLGYEVKPISPGSNTGDGHLMAMEAGAKMGNMTSFWGHGAMIDPTIVGRDGRPAPQMIMGLGAGSIIVNQQGRRFMHGGFTYNDFPKAFNNFDQRFPGLPNKPPAWVIFGPSVKDSRAILTMRPTDPAPDWLVQAPTLDELATKIGVDGGVLRQTVSEYNGYVEAGADPEWGDPTQTRQSLTGYDTSLAPLDGPPWYAIQQWPGTLGTNGGCRLNANAQVLGHRAEVVGGLYAAGNTSAAVLGGAYVGGGTPIACGATFGFIAGRHAAAQPDRDIG
jgi:succinate dehydrogenase/fumarate reductase flavoprotein subunit